MGIDLAGKCGQPRLNQQPALLLKFLFVARAVPDFDRDRDREERGQIDGSPIPRIVRFQVEDTILRLKQRAYELAKTFGGQDSGGKYKMVRGAAVVLAFLEKSINIEVEIGREAPDLVRAGG